MLEMLGRQGYETISIPDKITIGNIRSMLESGNPNPIVAEIGIGIGATSKHIAELLNNRGEYHLYDFEGRAKALMNDLSAIGYYNVKIFENSRRHWDSYHWSLLDRVRNCQKEVYDYIYLDGAHTFLHDCLAYILCDKLLKVNGVIDFDDYYWRFLGSAHMSNTRDEFMTQEQIEERQIKLVIDLFVKNNSRYEEVSPNKAYRKLSNSQDYD